MAPAPPSAWGPSVVQGGGRRMADTKVGWPSRDIRFCGGLAANVAPKSYISTDPFTES